LKEVISSIVVLQQLTDLPVPDPISLFIVGRDYACKEDTAVKGYEK
jgi:hypothetical protein